MTIKVLLELIIYFKMIYAGRRFSYDTLLQRHAEVCMSMRNLSECQNHFVERFERDAGMEFLNK